MNKLTTLSKVFLAIALVLSFVGIKILYQSYNPPEVTSAKVDTLSKAEVTKPDVVKSFSITSNDPVSGKLKGVIELGANGFNSFIVRIDSDKRWKLEKAEFGYSLAIENMSNKDDIQYGIKKYIASMLEYGVSNNNIHFVVSSGAVKAPNTLSIIDVLKNMKYFVTIVTPEQEGIYGLKAILPKEYESNSFVVDIGSGNTKISWKSGLDYTSKESYGAKYFQTSITDKEVFNDVSEKAKLVPATLTNTCFIIGGVPYEMAKAIRKNGERYTILGDQSSFNTEKAKSKAGLNIYNALYNATSCKQFVFDWDANFTIGFLLELPY